MIITCVRIMLGPNNPVGPMPAVSIVLTIGGAVLIILTIMPIGSMTMAELIRNASIIIGASRSKPYKISSTRPLHALSYVTNPDNCPRYHHLIRPKIYI